MDIMKQYAKLQEVLYGQAAVVPEDLKKYESTEFVFDDNERAFTPNKVLAFFKELIDNINKAYKGRDINVRMYSVNYGKNAQIFFSFSDNHNSGDCVASFVLHPIVRRIAKVNELTNLNTQNNEEKEKN